MVLRLKTWKSRSPPGSPSLHPHPDPNHPNHRGTARKLPAAGRADDRWQTGAHRAVGPATPPDPIPGPTQKAIAAGWSSPVARQAHNLKVVGSNPTPATNSLRKHNRLPQPPEAQPASGAVMSDQCPKNLRPPASDSDCI